MDVKQAVRKAIHYVTDIYADAKIKDVDVEEIVFDDARNAWKITVGFFRQWSPEKLAQVLGHIESRQWKNRTFKVVEINDGDGRVVSMTHRELCALN
ncbi:MAG: hypothetical protein OXP66_09755 [Candidatus Tectomicrobia bacterium]|nr:hypothetical protein [Candidatus Tectomicrobia bacterium]